MNSPRHELLDPPQKPGELGRLGPYRVTGVLGKGGMGEVFRANDSRLKRTVALKVMKSKFAATPNSRRRFVEEARSMAAVHHDNVATIFEVGVHQNMPFLAMELLKGSTIEKWLLEKTHFYDRANPDLCKTSRLRIGRRTQRRHHPPRHQASQHLDRRIRKLRSRCDGTRENS